MIMKKVALFVMALMMSVAANAQFEQGKFYCGASLSGLDLNYSGLTKGHVSIQGKVGYMLLDNLLATAQGSYDKAKDQPTIASFGLGARYYIEQNGIYLGASAIYKHAPGEEKAYNDVLPSVQVGYAFFLSRTVTVEPELYYEQSFKNHKDYSNFGLRVGIGIYLFNDMKKN